MEHYFSNDSTKEHDIREIEYSVKDLNMKFLTDNAVFSKARVDFGSELIIKTVLDNEKEVESLLEVGCGYGPMALSIAKGLNIKAVHMVDVNDRAIDLARQNAELNNVQGVVIKNSNIYENVEGKFDLIITNPPIRAGKNVVHTILSESINHMNDQGKIYVVIQKKQGAESAKKKLQEVYGNCEVVNKKAGFWILRSKKI